MTRLHILVSGLIIFLNFWAMSCLAQEIDLQEIIRENIRYKQEYYRYKEYVEKLLKTIADLKQTLADQQQQITKLNQQLDHKQAQIAYLHRQLEQREKVVFIRQSSPPTPIVQPTTRSLHESTSISSPPLPTIIPMAQPTAVPTIQPTATPLYIDPTPMPTLSAMETPTPIIIATETSQAISTLSETEAFCNSLQGQALSIWGPTENTRKQPRIINFECIKQYLDVDNIVYLIKIAYRPDENMTANLTRKNMLADARDLFQKFSVYPQIRQYLLRPHLTLIDKYGNEVEEQVAKIVLDQEIVTRINWTDKYSVNLEHILETDGQLWFHPAFRKKE